jgi:hypothetical protein
MAVGHNVFKFRKALPDSNGTDGLKELTRRIVISLSLDTLDFERLDACLQDELARQNIQISYAGSCDELFAKFITDHAVSYYDDSFHDNDCFLMSKAVSGYSGLLIPLR